MRRLRLLVALLPLLPGLNLLAAETAARARRAMVVTREAHATGAGLAVLRAGGNAVDAAVAVGFVLAVTHPRAGNIGGGGFLLVRFAGGRSAFVDFRERAPLAAGRDMYLDRAGAVTEESRIGWRAAGVPGTVRGLEYAHRKFGRKPWPELLAPAIRLAAKGFPLAESTARGFGENARLARFPESRRIFLKDGAGYRPGETLVQADLARTLERIARRGAADFYEGETARRLAAAMAANGGLITLEDLKQYEAVERRPLEGRYRGYGILTAPPPSSGGVGILQMLGVLEGSAEWNREPGSAAQVHLMTEAMRRFYADRSRFMGDPDFISVPVPALLSKSHIAELRRSIDPRRATPSGEVRAGGLPPAEPSETTHYSIVDAEGNAVAVTYTLNDSYGCGVTVPGLGFLLNNEMDDFAAKPGTPNSAGLVQGEANAIAPRKRPLSSMTPTIVTKDGKLHLVLGSPGGPRIITTVLEVLVDMLDFKMGVRQAVDQPRFHHQWLPDKLYMEPGFSAATRSALRALGHAIEPVKSIGEVAAIAVTEDGLEGAADSRVEGKAAGY